MSAIPVEDWFDGNGGLFLGNPLIAGLQENSEVAKIWPCSTE